MRLYILIFLSFIFGGSQAVDRSNFKTCDQAAFCKRHRNQNAKANYEVDPKSIVVNETGIDARLISTVNRLKLSIVLLEDSTLRVLIDEAGTVVRPRFQPLVALNGKPKQQRITAAGQDKDSASFVTPTGEKIVLTFKPFRIDVFIKNELVVSINSKNLLKFEHFREKGAGDTEEEGFWEESFKSFRDSKPFGSSSVGLDISFVGYKFIYGIPNADSFALRSTTNSEPYRFYNLDVFEYELNNPMALYGSIPYVIAHNQHQTLSLLWLNSAETWADIHSSTADKGMLASLVDKFRPSSEVPQIDVHFISESGVIDLFLFLGPKPKDIFRQYSTLTGVTPLPPEFAIAYHQCRWNYKDEADVAGVHAGFDEYDIPFDVIWLDIEYTDGKKYFTWDEQKFPNPKDMQDNLAAKGRKLVTIIDPHIKKDSNYHIYKEAQDNGFFVKKANGEDDYEGHCWPGASSYLDYMNPKVSDWWASQYAFDKFPGSTQNLWIWNDMNEPSVFSGPETTMEKDSRHFGGWEHREIHNIYGLMMHTATHKGLLQRTNNKLRPFILTRSFFVGTQRTAAVWTGDNAADWGHLKSSVPMLLKLSASGIPFVGADVGGFFKNPDEQLLVRWYQAGAFQPFFRAHAHIDTRRREPWLFSETTREAIRKAIKMRYMFLPYWYTLFYEHEKTGLPILRPIWSEFPEDQASFDEEREWMVGNAILVRPVMDPDVTQTSLYIPGTGGVWYEWDTHRSRPSPGAVYVDTPIDKIPVFQRGGTIIPVRERPRRASKWMKNDPITLYVATNYKDFANGTLYLDDGETFEYRNGDYLYWGYTFKKLNDYDYTITSKSLDKNGKFDPDVWVDKIIIRGVRFYPRNIHLYYDDYTPTDLEFEHDREKHIITIRKPGAYVSREWRIDIHC